LSEIGTAQAAKRRVHTAAQVVDSLDRTPAAAGGALSQSQAPTGRVRVTTVLFPSGSGRRVG